MRLNSLVKKNNETLNAQISVIGVAYIIPSIPKKWDKINNVGNKIIICLVSATVTPILGLPIAEKNVELEIWIPLIKVNNKKNLIYLTANSKYSSLPLPKAATICLGNSSNIEKNGSSKTGSSASLGFWSNSRYE